jgi:hypothetical protein
LQNNDVAFATQLSLPWRASEVIFDSEVYSVSEVLPDGEVANLTSLLQSKNFTTNEMSNFTFAKQKLHPTLKRRT